MIYRADLHVHSCLSACADDSMTPEYIARAEKEKGVNLCALTDHNSALNCPAFAEACRKYGIAPLFGLEISSAEQAHVLALYDRLEAAMEMSAHIFRNLTSHEKLSDHYGNQIVVSTDGSEQSTENTFLTVPCKFSFNELYKIVNKSGGLFIPAHINRKMFSVRSQLGKLPDNNYDMLEMYVPDGSEPYPIICNSDAHWPDAVGFRTTEFRIPPENERLPLLEQIKKAAETASFSTFSPGK